MLISSSVGEWKNGATNHLKDVSTIQSLLTSLSILTKKIEYDPRGIGSQIPKPPKDSDTVAAIIAFQGTFMTKPDGVIQPGKTTYLRLLAALKLAQFPSRPSFLPVTGNKAKADKFGAFKWEPIKDKKAGKVLPGSEVRLLDNWASENIVRVEIPGLRSIPFSWNPAGRTSAMTFNKSCVRQLVNLWQDWNKADLHKRITSYGGAYIARLIRDDTIKLSSHAWGTAFDINVNENKRGKTPAHLGDPGCVREMVAIANAHGFYWGGHFSKPDGMHFEIAIVNAAPAVAVRTAVVETNPTGMHFHRDRAGSQRHPLDDIPI
ncbi:MAG: M15 family metallopeptidase [Gammaproteobacteria bacterium]|nr:M15 family metallopeptidase [Gammaproteobacteria bacterium]